MGVFNKNYKKNLIGKFFKVILWNEWNKIMKYVKYISDILTFKKINLYY